MFSAVAATKGLELTLEAASGLPLAVRADAGKVRQVLINMVGNAMKFTERGEVTIRASSTRRGNGYLIAVAVQDTGPGIAAEDLPRVFGAFEQLGLGVRIGGTGLGLAISREFAHLMGGDLSVNSSAGVGSTFTFTFAVEEASSHELVRTESKALPVGITKDRPVPKILVVDDQFAGREVAREVLAGIGFDARVAASGEEAIQIHDSWRPDLVLMDLRMPGIGGLEAMRRLRAAGSKTVLVAFTASSIEEAPRESRAAGADDILLKPYREADLFRILGERLDVEYVYEPSEGPAPLAVVLTSDPSALSESLRNMPADLLDSLRTAALQARARRIEELVVDVAAYSSEAAGQIRALARDFRYDDLVTALDEATQRSIESLPPRGV
jgi:CheY-like chemotaxis protein